MSDFRPDFRRKTTDLVDFTIGKSALPPPPSSSMLTFVDFYRDILLGNCPEMFTSATRTVVFREGLVAMVSTLKGGGGGDKPFPNKEPH